MRDLLIVSIVAVMAVMALRRPWIGVMLWTWLSIMNPHRYAWGFAYSAPLAATAALATLAGLMMTRERQHPFKGAPVTWFFLLSLWITLSWLFGYDPSGDYAQWNKVMKIYFMTFVALMLLDNRHHIMAFAWVSAFSLALLGAKGGLFTIAHGGNYRVWGPMGTFIGDNNHFALALIMTVPLLHFLQLQLTRPWMRHGMSVIMLLCVASALGSHSRGALLAVSAMGAVLWWRSRRKGVMTLALLVVILMLLPMMPEEWWERMGTIKSYEEDASAMGRINGWLVAIEVAKHHFFGGGMSYQHDVFFLMWGVHNTDVIAAHSIYFQILGNHGFVGLALYLGFWFVTYAWAGWLRRNARDIPQARWAADLGGMVQVSLVGFAVGGAFLSMPYFDLPYNLMVMVVLARRWVETRGWERDPPGSLLEYAGLGRFLRRSPARAGA
ncbi:putative O-glycosylation ligase, exosortase A system-associated [Pseudothauera lacus]|uniref:Putative O-glycosylation ligase, exosortase A system-associated n=1 Tax=Pseudothauera lacus TaxID=2136175 RepID=A0A2T4IG93_9RHOO|nr:putative O-glycosylation ligase, exosortase A system-associated [Pseudothauera lacus]PTD96767.1 putative O-glycosylation ligase, exosortase A system-associated [Pseudothauera lacus]